MNQPKPNITVSGQDLIVHPALQGYQIYNRKSSFIAYIATEVTGTTGNKLFVQFNNGVCVLLSDVPKEIIGRAVAASSIGKFWHAELKDRFKATEIDANCIALAETDDDDDDFDLEF